MRRKPKINLGGLMGFELSRLWDAVLQREEAVSSNIRTNRTTRGTTFKVKAQPAVDSGMARPALIVDETLQWLKCTFDLDWTEGDTTFVWVAKPPDLRVPLPALTFELFEAHPWGAPFAGEIFLYRNAAERLRRFTNVNQISLHRGFTPYEAWPTATNRANIDTYAVSGAAATPWDEDRIGNVDWLYDFQVVYPVYKLFTGFIGEAATHNGQGRIIYVTRLHPSDEVLEVPEDETFAGLKYLDLNLGRRGWISKREVYPRWMVQLNDGGTTTPDLTGGNAAGFAAFPPQFNDQIFTNDTPQVRDEILDNYWGEI